MKSVLCAAATLVFLASAACGQTDSDLVVACESALKDMLAAPSTYRRIKITETSEDLALDAYFAANESTETIEAFQRRLHDKAVRWIARVEYEAQNFFGTPLRRVSLCTYDSLSADTPTPSAFTVRIDGKTKTDYLIDAIRQRTR